MFKEKPAFSGFSTNDLAAATEFYGTVLGLQVEAKPMGLELQLNGGGRVFIYLKDDHIPATFTVLNLKVANIDQAATDLVAQAVILEHYEGWTDEAGIARGISRNQGPDILWFKDPAGNILSALQDA